MHKPARAEFVGGQCELRDQRDLQADGDGRPQRDTKGHRQRCRQPSTGDIVGNWLVEGIIVQSRRRIGGEKSQSRLSAAERRGSDIAINSRRVGLSECDIEPPVKPTATAKDGFAEIPLRFDEHDCRPSTEHADWPASPILTQRIVRLNLGNALGHHFRQGRDRGHRIRSQRSGHDRSIRHVKALVAEDLSKICAIGTGDAF